MVLNKAIFYPNCSFLIALGINVRRLNIIGQIKNRRSSLFAAIQHFSYKRTFYKTNLIYTRTESLQNSLIKEEPDECSTNTYKNCLRYHLENGRSSKVVATWALLAGRKFIHRKFVRLCFVNYIYTYVISRYRMKTGPWQIEFLIPGTRILQLVQLSSRRTPIENLHEVEFPVAVYNL